MCQQHLLPHLREHRSPVGTKLVHPFMLNADMPALIIYLPARHDTDIITRRSCGNPDL
jgi:hypothetical protein